MARFVIWSPDYTHKSGGIRALHLLADALNMAGKTAEVMHEFRPVPDDCVMIYPEIVRGNPCEAAHVVRWCLRPNRREWPGDLVFKWDEAFDIPADGLLYIPILDRTHFHRSTIQFPRNMVLTYKAARVPGDIEITDEWPDSWDEMQMLFWRAKVLRCGDPLTLLAAEAALCGCPVQMLAGCVGTIDPSDADFEEKFLGYERRSPELMKRFIEQTDRWMSVSVETDPPADGGILETATRNPAEYTVGKGGRR